MTQQQEQVRPARPRPVMRAVRVSKVENVTPHLVRVTLEGDELQGFATRGPAEHMRIFFPEPGQPRPVMPQRDEQGRPLEGQPRPTSRVYTPRRWQPETNQLQVEIVLHDEVEGPGATWARGVKPGAEVVVSGPAGPYNVDASAEWFVIAGDHAGLPAIETVLETLPAGARATVYAEVPDAAEEIALHSAASFETVWLHADHEVPGKRLTEALRQAELPQGNGRVFVACEAGAMREIKRHLLHERNLPREAVHTHGYWQHGEANHPDHDLGQEIE
jgi:NADPH-dependent ferric siderophore reductase